MPEQSLKVYGKITVLPRENAEIQALNRVLHKSLDFLPVLVQRISLLELHEFFVKEVGVDRWMGGWDDKTGRIIVRNPTFV
jgi:hypothetical protein